MAKRYSAPTGVSHFYYGVLDGNQIEAESTPERVKFAQTITAEMPQEATRAHGDNVTAEIAISSGNVTLSGAFHTIPDEDKVKLLGQETVDGITAIGSEDKPPYVGVVFCQTFEDGSRRWLGFTKGMFMRNNVEAQTKTESTEFSSEEINAEFMSREVEGFDKRKVALRGYDEEGETTNRDTIFTKIFGVPYPGDEPDPEEA